MIKKALYTIVSIILFAVSLISISCAQVSETEGNRYHDNSPQDNFITLWTIMDEHYCFFDLKRDKLGVDWYEVLVRYAASISDDMSDRALFEVLCNMIGELRDGHVNLSSPYDVGRNWSWKTDYPANFSKDLQNSYLGNNYVIAANGYYYRILDDNIGYLVVESFESSMSRTAINVMFSDMALCHGLIIDIRDNGGGDESAAEFLASHFTEEPVLVGYSRYKTGPGHNDFSKYYENVLNPAWEDYRWIKPVVVITNRGCFSSANEFAYYMKALHNVTLLGDWTGGGGGFPMSSELPNGWVVRFSSAPSFDAEKQHVEQGVSPDLYMQMKTTDVANGVDTYIEASRTYINSYLRNR